jgi:hypothetical protein
MNQGISVRSRGKKKEKMQVIIAAPMNPSQVFLGDKERKEV